MSDLTAITRKEKIISGEDLKPITREEMFLQKYRGSGGGGGASVQSDWNESNETSAAFVKNRTHYVIPATESRTNTLTWDGNYEGKEVSETVLDGYGTIRQVKLSDSVCAINDLIGGTITTNDGETVELTSENVVDMSSEGQPILSIMEGTAAVVLEDFTDPSSGMAYTKGVWVIRWDYAAGDVTYATSLTAVTDCFTVMGEETVVPFDGKFLPNGLGYIIKEGEQTATNTLTWDGNASGLENIPMSETVGYYKVSDSVPTVSDLLGGSVVIYHAGEEITVPITTDTLNDDSADTKALVIYEESLGVEAVIIQLEDYSADGMTATKGIYVIGGEGPNGTLYVKSLTCLTDCFVSGEPAEIQKIDNRLLDVEWLATKTVKEIPIWDNVSVSLQKQQAGAGISFYNSHERYFELIADKTYNVTWGGVKFENVIPIDLSGATILGNLAALGGEGGEEYPFAIVHNVNYLAVSDVTATENVTVTVSIAETETTWDRLPEEFLPETLLATIADLEARIAALEAAGATE